MKKGEIVYKISTATKEDVYKHLVICNDNFLPVLSLRTDIKEYAEKIVILSITFEAWHDGLLAGLIAVYVNDPAGQVAFITNVSVKKNLMGEGIASALLTKLIDYVTRKHFAEISLEVNKKNYPAIRFYGKFNFLQDGTSEDNLVMKKKLHTTI